MTFIHLTMTFDLMILILKLDLDMVKMYTKNQVPSYRGSKVIA